MQRDHRFGARRTKLTKCRLLSLILCGDSILFTWLYILFPSMYLGPIIFFRNCTDLRPLRKTSFWTMQLANLNLHLCRKLCSSSPSQHSKDMPNQRSYSLKELHLEESSRMGDEIPKRRWRMRRAPTGSFRSPQDARKNRARPVLPEGSKFAP